MRIELTKNRDKEILLFISSTVFAVLLASLVAANPLAAILMTIAFVGFVILFLGTSFSPLFLIFMLAPFTGFVKVFFGVSEVPLAFDIILVITTLHAFSQNLLSKQIKKPGNLSRLPMVSLLILIFLLLGLFGILNPNIPDLQFGLEGFRLSVFYFIAFFAAWFLCNSKDDVVNIIKALMYPSLIVASYGIYQFFNPSPAEIAYYSNKFWVGQIRAFSTMIGNVHYGMYMALTGLGAMSFWANKCRLEKIPYKLIILLTAIGLIFSLSRASWVGMLLGIAVILLFSAKRNKSALFLRGLILISALFLLISIASRSVDVVQKRILTLTNLYDSSLQTRLQMWPDLVAKTNLFGYGVGVSGFNQYINVPGVGVLWADNQFIKVALEMGYLGLFLFCFILALTVIKGLRLSKNLKDQFLRTVAIWITAFCVGIMSKMFSGQVLEAYPLNLYFCFLVGVLYKLEYMEG